MPSALHEWMLPQVTAAFAADDVAIMFLKGPFWSCNERQSSHRRPHHRVRGRGGGILSHSGKPFQASAAARSVTVLLRRAAPAEHPSIAVRCPH